jgi:succinylarginine dihydrolase
MAYDSGTGESVVLAVSPNTRALLVSGSFASTPVQSNTASVVAQTTVGTTSVQILAANAARKRVRVQNSGTTVIKLGFGRTPTQTAYHRALPAGGSADDGSSPPLEDMTWTGAINAISSTVGGTCVVEEDT